MLTSQSLAYTSDLRLKFLTPVRLQTDGKVVMNKLNITPELLITNIVRRCVVISYFYCGGSYKKIHFDGIDKISATDNHLRFFDWSRYSNRQNTKMQMGGFVGNIILSNVPSSVIPSIYAGSHLGIGKHTVFGMGKYVIEQGSVDHENEEL